MKFGIQNFRCFANVPPIDIRPITLLVGENSTGKTSFLAGFRFLNELFQRGANPSFNKDPYSLGSFKEIAHFRGGRAGRANELSFFLSVPVRLRRDVRQSLWGEACVTLGRDLAAVALAIVSTKEPEHFRSTPGGYFHGMVAKARAGELHLDRTVWAWRRAATPEHQRDRGEDRDGRNGSRAL